MVALRSRQLEDKLPGMLQRGQLHGAARHSQILHHHSLATLLQQHAGMKDNYLQLRLRYPAPARSICDNPEVQGPEMVSSLLGA